VREPATATTSSVSVTIRRRPTDTFHRYPRPDISVRIGDIDGTGNRRSVLRPQPPPAAPPPQHPQLLPSTPLADPRHLSDLIDVFTNMLDWLPENGVTEFPELLISELKGLAAGTLDGLDGLQAICPTGA
jgi:hypothetical protein